ncbi:tripartite tricarboxylate transporter permease [Candidatus Epulonipiscium viviparus]|uniref:tripartite tricarboxylate transporter permease n=1 Tax=Candidatus Epulonipiscium viviparus TaxID=420336 RepID=UPI0027380DCB|nr:tripartite tricarboxylate transporter permease [Candidatus Epulopiscium viviparus]
MEFLELLQNIMNFECLSLILIGVIIGNVFGCIPGLNGPIAVALILPVTFSLEVIPSMSLIMGIYMGSVTGGTAASVATTFDGYPMTQNGRAADALSIGAFASVFGGLFSAVVLLFLAPTLSSMAIAFGPWEYFGTAVLSLSLVCSMMSGKRLKGFIAMMIGLLLTTVGMSPVDGIASRYTFGLSGLENGFDLVVVIIGVFALPEIIYSLGNISDKPVPAQVEKKWFYAPKLSSIKKNFKVMLQGSFLGTAIGILPGMGGGAAGLISYEQAKRSSKTPEKFGTGHEAGIYSCESANNATTGGALVPMLALGVPGDTVTAIIMGAIALQGLTPGPTLSMQQPELFRTIILIVFVANIFMYLYQATTIRFMAKIIDIPKYLLFPIVAVFCAIGVISINNSMFDLLLQLIRSGII